MGFSVDYSGLVATHVLDEAAVIFALIRWIVSWALLLLVSSFPSSSCSSSSSDYLVLQMQTPPRSGPSSSFSSTTSLASPRKKQNCLISTTSAELTRRFPEEEEEEEEGCETCAVCLNQLRKREDQLVTELDNCRHVFHRQCIDRWLDNDIHKTCPLCRGSLPLLTVTPAASPCLTSGSGTTSQPQPSWAVEQILYLFGDELLIH